MNGNLQWRMTPAGAWILQNGKPAAGDSPGSADIANVYQVASRPGIWCGNPWGHPSRDFEGKTAPENARAYVESFFKG